MNKRLNGGVRDIHPNNERRVWEIFFNKTLHGDDFPKTHESKIEVEWPDGVYRGKIGIKPNNDIYLWIDAFHMASGRDHKVPDLCERHGFGRVGEIEFEVVVPKKRYRVVC